MAALTWYVRVAEDNTLSSSSEDEQNGTPSKNKFIQTRCEQHAAKKHARVGVVSREIPEALLDRPQRSQPAYTLEAAILYPPVLERLVR